MAHMLETGVFWYGDNLEVMREYLTSDGEVHLIYLDPPFNSRKAYNSFMVEDDATISRAQLTAFEDYWPLGASTLCRPRSLTPCKCSAACLATET